MAKEPKLILEFGTDGIPVSGKCSACGEQMSAGPARVTHKEEVTKRFEDEFRIHVARKHGPREDVNQAAARIVREATKG